MSATDVSDGDISVFKTRENKTCDASDYGLSQIMKILATNDLVPPLKKSGDSALAMSDGKAVTSQARLASPSTYLKVG